MSGRSDQNAIGACLATRRLSLPRLGLVALFVSAGCAAGPAPAGLHEGDGDGDDDGDTGTTRSPLVGATGAATTHAELVTVDGNLASGYVYGCTGTLVTSHLVLTAGHCVVYPGVYRYTVKAPYAGGQSAIGTQSFTYDYQPGDIDQVHLDQYDVGVVVLDTEIRLPQFDGKPSYAKVSVTTLNDGIAMLDYGRVANGGLSFSDIFVSSPFGVHPGTDEYANLGKYYLRRGDVIEPGDSGGPLEKPNPKADGRYKVFAVNSGTGGTPIWARVDLPDINAWLHTQIAAHP